MVHAFLHGIWEVTSPKPVTLGLFGIIVFIRCGPIENLIRQVELRLYAFVGTFACFLE